MLSRIWFLLPHHSNIPKVGLTMQIVSYLIWKKGKKKKKKTCFLLSISIPLLEAKTSLWFQCLVCMYIQCVISIFGLYVGILYMPGISTSFHTPWLVVVFINNSVSSYQTLLFDKDRPRLNLAFALCLPHKLPATTCKCMLFLKFFNKISQWWRSSVTASTVHVKDFQYI